MVDAPRGAGRPEERLEATPGAVIVWSHEAWENKKHRGRELVSTRSSQADGRWEQVRAGNQTALVGWREEGEGREGGRRDARLTGCMNARHQFPCLHSPTRYFVQRWEWMDSTAPALGQRLRVGLGGARVVSCRGATEAQWGPAKLAASGQTGTPAGAGKVPPRGCPCWSGMLRAAQGAGEGQAPE